MVDHEEPSIRREQAVPGLAVAVVRDDVEERDPTEVVGPFVAHRQVVTSAGSNSTKSCTEPSPWGRRAGRSAAPGPAEGLGRDVRGDLAATERALGEVPQGCLAGPRLVDREHRIGAPPQADEERCSSRTAGAGRAARARPRAGAAEDLGADLVHPRPALRDRSSPGTCDPRDRSGCRRTGTRDVPAPRPPPRAGRGPASGRASPTDGSSRARVRRSRRGPPPRPPPRRRGRAPRAPAG